eukprot:NODE_532_length_6386_cov_0.597264.p4 type:complete len:157 gc:universal NODE_532_length_6386_cov_0.597264:5808-5338(-)
MKKSKQFQYDLNELMEIYDDLENDEYLACITINPQHNPTGINMSESQVNQLIQFADEHKSAFLIDDANFGICSAAKPTIALKLLANYIQSDAYSGSLLWCQVRSLGKQFSSNGWGIGKFNLFRFLCGTSSCVKTIDVEILLCTFLWFWCPITTSHV